MYDVEFDKEDCIAMLKAGEYLYSRQVLTTAEKAFSRDDMVISVNVLRVNGNGNAVLTQVTRGYDMRDICEFGPISNFE